MTQNTQEEELSEEDTEKLRMSSALIFTIYERYKRILLAYLHTRFDRVKSISTMHHESIENTPIWKDLSDNEQRFATEYRQLIDSYGEEIGFDLYKHANPPKGDCVEVEVLKTSGSRLLESGKTYNLVQGSHLFIQLGDAEYLIQQGLVKLIS
ncbi:predicted protein [Naegleria gruberi]|uniref:Predicted protein n=1 Tax=Naegleria gruberi TaxID=5762 RepID=D2VZQ7_NAEGR|nr:uncharacterized protein NAEGRDRAFT_74580 [Naegleria gruberi]EFC37741.1 predicted protein [Naegleria gruberi]|eukprot:XP_002670485.1 predicted protein [Naegleria gruberi strain NEG-M]